MGCVGSDVEDELRAKTGCLSKRFKFSKKSGDDGVAVDFASVPRKLRSAIKKRSRESISLHLPNYNKLNRTRNGVELSRNNGLKKFKGVSDGSGRQISTGPITKDEEEVAETLHALAAMFPDSAEIDKTKTEGGQTLETKSSAFLVVENRRHGLEDTAAMEESSGTKTISTDNAEAANVDSCALTGQNTEPRLKLPQPDSSLRSDKVETMAADIRCQSEVLYTNRENKNNGSQLWPGLSSTETRGFKMQRPSPQSSTSKLPATFLDTSCPLQLPTSGKFSTTLKGPQVQVNAKKSRKRWPTNVYISRLIKNLQMTKREKTLQMKCTQSKTNEGLNQGARKNPNNLNERSNGLNGIMSTETAVSSATGSKSDEIRNAILLHKRLLQDQQQASTSSRFYALQKQNIDFLPLSAGGVRTEISNVTAKADHGQLHIPHLQSQNRPIIPFLWQQNCYSSNPFVSHTGAVATHQVQLRPYLGNTNCRPSVTTSSKQQPFLQPQQQNKTGRVAAPGIPNWQNGGHDAPSLIHYAQSIFPPSHYAQTSREQQNFLIVPPPQPPTREQGHNHSLPYKSYEDKGVTRRTPETVPPMQLLCNEHF